MCEGATVLVRTVLAYKKNKYEIEEYSFIVFTAKFFVDLSCQYKLRRLTLIIEFAFDSLKVGVNIHCLIFHVLLRHWLHLTITLRRHRLWRGILSLLLGMPLHLSAMMRAFTVSQVRMRHSSAASSTTASNIAICWIMNLMRSAHNSLLWRSRYYHSSWLLILNGSLRVLNLLLRNWL